MWERDLVDSNSGEIGANRIGLILKCMQWILRKASISTDTQRIRFAILRETPCVYLCTLSTPSLYLTCSNALQINPSCCASLPTHCLPADDCMWKSRRQKRGHIRPAKSS